MAAVRLSSVSRDQGLRWCRRQAVSDSALDRLHRPSRELAGSDAPRRRRTLRVVVSAHADECSAPAQECGGLNVAAESDSILWAASIGISV
jgi:hypothetical protein